MSSIDRLSDIFKSFPGIGPRQARRFVYFLLSRSAYELDEFKMAIESLKKDFSQCIRCQRFFQPKNSTFQKCFTCVDERRDQGYLMIVAKDVDMEAVEKSHVFEGTYFVLGSTIPILDKEPEKRVRLEELKTRLINEKSLIKEIILAFSLNPEGEHTTEYIEEFLSPIIKENSIKISHLGRGLSSGAELEYSDSETLKSALKNRF